MLRPKLWSLTRRADCRIFQNLSASEIVKQVLDDDGLASNDYKLTLTSTCPTRVYCVQYRETDFNFVSRLMEEEGIYYFFQHSASGHVLVMCDAPSAHETVNGYENIRYDAPDQQPKPDHISEWEPLGQVAPGKCTLRDYDFTNSALQLTGTSQTLSFTAFEIYDYPGLFTTADVGSTHASLRMEAMEVPIQQWTGGGPVLGITTGCKFTLTNHPRIDENAAYLVIASDFELKSDAFQAASGKPVGPGFECDFTAIAAAKQYRPPRLAPKPFVQGPQTALVVGPQGSDDLYTDSYGRIKVQFHWDRLGKKDENSSCWIRVASIWAGNAWGAMQLPRIGQEVIVDFLEGDPDQPIITGRVYNDLNKVPYTLPDNKTQSTIKSRSSTQGTDANFNELRFEDKKGSEEIYFHAERDFNREVENNDTLKVGFDTKSNGDQTIEIFNNQSLTVGNNQSADGSQTVSIWNNRTVTIQQGNEKLEVSTGNRQVLVDQGNDTHEVKVGNRQVTVDQGNDTHEVKVGNREVTIDQGNDTHTISQGYRKVEISQGDDTLTVTAGDQTIQITAGKSSTQAGTSIELTVGGSSIKIEPAKITISSAEIDIVGSAKVSIQAPMIQASADGMLQLQGGVTKIN